MICVLAPVRQKEWGWAAIANFLLGGAGAGYYLIRFFIGCCLLSGITPAAQTKTAVISAIFMSVGLLCVAMEAGRPLLGYRAILGVTRSWISREMLCFMFFVGFAIADILASAWWCKVGLAVTALCFIICQTMVLKVASAIKSWQPTLIAVLMLSSAFVSGVSVLFILEPNLVLMRYGFFMAFGIIIMASSNLIWCSCILGDPVFSGIKPWKGSLIKRFGVGIGRLLPLGLLALLVLLPANVLPFHYIQAALLVIGITSLIGSLILTRWILREAGMKCAVCFE